MIKLLVVATLAMVPNFIFALGEEIGWRGYLQLRLVQTGWPFPYVICGLIWAGWHFPWEIQPNTLQVALFIACITLSGIFIGWLRMASGSVWVATLAHAAHNAFFFDFFARSFPPTGETYWVAEGGFLPVIGYGIVVLVLFFGAWHFPIQHAQPVLPEPDQSSGPAKWDGAAYRFIYQSIHRLVHHSPLGFRRRVHQQSGRSDPRVHYLREPIPLR